MILTRGKALHGTTFDEWSEVHDPSSPLSTFMEHWGPGVVVSVDTMAGTRQWKNVEESDEASREQTQ